MTGATSSKEWYEADQQPGPYEEPTFTHVFMQLGRNLGKQFSLIQGNFGAAVNSIGTHFHDAVVIHYDLARPHPDAETPRERALRLKQQPHSMASKSGRNFNRHGQQRY